PTLLLHSLTISPSYILHSFSFHTYGDHRDLHSFLHDALPICLQSETTDNPLRFKTTSPETSRSTSAFALGGSRTPRHLDCVPTLDRKSTRLNSSHVAISYAVFCLKKKIKPTSNYTRA